MAPGENDQIERWELEERIERAGQNTLDRLRMLVQKGYQPDFSGEPFGSIWLYHPRESFKHNLLYLYGDGAIISAHDKPDEGQDKYRIDREEAEEFNKFLRTIPAPSLWERTRRGRINIYAWLMICGVMLVGGLIGLIALELVKALWRFISRFVTRKPPPFFSGGWPSSFIKCAILLS
jgi:hypothetical protein